MPARPVEKLALLAPFKPCSYEGDLTSFLLQKHLRSTGVLPFLKNAKSAMCHATVLKPADRH
jgi:hypothetical protein